jgi:hypothetical protein
MLGFFLVADGVVILVLATALLEDAERRPALPMLRHGAARQTLEADLLEHLRRLESEPGVRGRL